MPISPKVLVVGTTADYIDWIRRSCPGRAIFLTNPSIRARAQEPTPSPAEEILCDLSDYEQARQALQRHLKRESLAIDGITSYDCESLELAAVLAQDFALSYPSVAAVRNCRDKHLSKDLWRQNSVPCPRSRLIQTGSDAIRFFKEVNSPCVLKPLCGSGSELTFFCNSAEDCERNFNEISRGLERRRDYPLFRSTPFDHPLILAEELLTGAEYSCDFLMEAGRVDVIRLSRKIPSKAGPFGTTQGYILPATLPEGIEMGAFRRTLLQGAEALGLFRAICMLDFFIREKEIVLLEMTPRPGGDCLPFLLRHSLHLDILQLSLDFAQQRPVRLATPGDTDPYIGLRLHARNGGILKKVDTQGLQQDPRVQEVHLIRRPGHVIRMPPADYDSWLLGHIILRPQKGNPDPETQCNEIFRSITIEIGNA